MSKLVSIIVPVYKVEAYLDACVRSLIAQTYPNTELIFVDDGSPDHCGAMLDRYKESNPELIVIHKQNGGVSAARNDGLAASSGEYIMFVDGDDYVEPDYVSYFVALLEKDNCDMAVSTRCFKQGMQPQDAERYHVADAAEIVEAIYLNRVGVAVWNKLYRRSVLEENKLIFHTDYWFAEGMLYNILYLQYVKRVAVGNRRVYHFADNDNSATRLFRLESYLCGLRSMEYQRDHWVYSNDRIKMAWEYHYRRYAEVILIGLLRTDSVSEHRDVFDACRRALKRNLKIPLQVDINIWAQTAAVCAIIDPVRTYCPKCALAQRKGWKQRWNLFWIKAVNKTPERLRRFCFDKIKKHCRKHYKPVYLEKKLL